MKGIQIKLFHLLLWVTENLGRPLTQRDSEQTQWNSKSNSEDTRFLFEDGSPSQRIIGLEYLHPLCVCLYINSQGNKGEDKLPDLSLSTVNYLTILRIQD